jgi:CubicO group peptidase (beta-lactamase class C family)
MGNTQAADQVHGAVAPGFEAVREVFVENFRERGEIGAACAVYFRGDKVVDLWGGRRDHTTGAPWEEDTMVVVFSTTKGMSGLALAVAHARGFFRYDERVATYWPEFAQQGKGGVTVRQLLGHRAGLPVIDKPLDVAAIGESDGERVAAALAAQRPAWRPGEKRGYHAVTMGLYERELIRRVDPQKRSIGKFFRDEVADPLGIEFHIGLPASVPSSRVARIKGYDKLEPLLHVHTLPRRFLLSLANPRSLASRAFANPRLRNPADLDAPAWRSVELPGSNGIGSARAIARAYSVFATGGAELGIGRETLDAIGTPVMPEPGLDEVLKVDTTFSLGFVRPCGWTRFGSSDRSFGAPGMGGSFGFADPDLGLGFAYVMNRMGFHMADDPREKALREATYQCVGGRRT